jgi:hypothetical protein
MGCLCWGALKRAAPCPPRAWLSTAVHMAAVPAAGSVPVGGGMPGGMGGGMPGGMGGGMPGGMGGGMPGGGPGDMPYDPSLGGMPPM